MTLPAGANVLVLGASGLLGQAVMHEAERRNITAVGAARRDVSIVLDLEDDTALEDTLKAIKPEVVINCAACVDVARCEADPGFAYRLNALPLARLATWANATGGKIVHISTDHFFAGSGRRAHAEDDPIVLINEYARTKYAAECFALLCKSSLVLRTSIVGIRGWPSPTFAEWAIASVLSDAEMTLFSDAWTSSIDVGTFASCVFDLIYSGAAGRINLASGDVYSKEAFIREIARQCDVELTNATSGSVTALVPPRPSSLGLDVSKAEALLGRKLPTMNEVVAAILTQYRTRHVTPQHV